MSKFNKGDAKATVTSPMISTGTSRTHEGGLAWERDDKSALLLLAVTNMVGEDTFYEKANDRDARYRDLVHKVAVTDYGWMLQFVRWLRNAANMRSASAVAACEAVKARLDAKLAPAGRAFIDAACARADEPGEVLAYWTSRYGRKLPKPVKRGVADAVQRLYTERNFLKYDSDAKGYRFADVLELTHPAPADDKPYQGALFQHAIDKRHGRADGVPESLRMITRNALLRSEGDLDDWLNPDILRQAGMTWEDVLSAHGSKGNKAKLWEAIIPSMGVMALLRNLRNFDEAGVSDEVAAQVCAKLSNPEDVRGARVFPYRMLQAYAAAPSLRWGHALDKALDAACQNLPALDGKTLVLVDTSGSMTNPVSQKSTIAHLEIGALFGVALAMRGNDVDLIGFADGQFPHSLVKGGSALRQIASFCTKAGAVGHGTRMVEAVRATYRETVHKRVVIISDMQTFPYLGLGSPGAFSRNPNSVNNIVPETVPIFGVNTTGNKSTPINLSQPNRYEIGGFNDSMFKMMDLLSRGRDAGWPWEL